MLYPKGTGAVKNYFAAPACPTGCAEASSNGHGRKVLAGTVCKWKAVISSRHLRVTTTDAAGRKHPVQRNVVEKLREILERTALLKDHHCLLLMQRRRAKLSMLYFAMKARGMTLP